VKTIECAGWKFSAKSYQDLSGADWERITKNFERAAAESGQMFAAVRAMIVVICPMAARPLQTMSEAEFFSLARTVGQHIGDELQALGSLFVDRLSPSLGKFLVNFNAALAEKGE
jgi:hypothetical protein